MIREAFQDLNRLRQIAVTAARYGFADILERSDVWRTLGRKETVELSPEAQRASTARRFRLFLNELGPTFIKLGQVLSSRADLLPAEVIDELAQLQDNVAPMSHETVLSQIQSAFRAPPETLFSTISKEPLAAASIAQVHRATTLAGEEVVIKVQRPGIADQLRSDLSVLRQLARILEAVVEETGVYSPTGVVDEFDRAIHEELDFLNEASNVRAFYATHEGRPNMRIPRVHENLSSRTVLTMEFLAGTKVSAIDPNKVDREKVAMTIVDGAFRQLFVDGLFHGDPHPGNILVLENDVVALIDFGLVGRLTKQMQEVVIMLSLGVAIRDADSVARLLYRVGIPDGRANLQAFRNDIEQILETHLGATLSQMDAKNILRDLLDLAVRYRIRIPKEYAILSRAAIPLEGIIRSLSPDLEMSKVLGPYAKELLAGRYDPSNLQGSVMKTLLRIQGFANDIPIQLSQILLDAEAGKFGVTVRVEGMKDMTSILRSMAVVAFMGLLACGFIVGAFISFAQRPAWLYEGIPVLGVLAIAAVGALFGGTLSWWLFGGRFRKLRLAGFLKGRLSR